MNHIMLDLETLGNRINPVIVQISAVQFDLETGAKGKEFDLLITRQSCLDVGLEENESTIKWWSEQEQSAKDKVFGEQLPRVDIEAALKRFTLFVNDIKKDGEVYLWGNGIRADNTWLLAAYKACGIDDPIGYNEDLDFRTIHYLAKNITGRDVKKEVVFEGVKHNAIDDCKWQIEAVSRMYHAIKSIKSFK